MTSISADLATGFRRVRAVWRIAQRRRASRPWPPVTGGEHQGLERTCVSLRDDDGAARVERALEALIGGLARDGRRKPGAR